MKTAFFSKTVLVLFAFLGLAACKAEQPAEKKTEVNKGKKAEDKEWHVFEWGKPATFQFGKQIETVNFKDFSMKYLGRHKTTLKDDYRLIVNDGYVDVGVETEVEYHEFEVFKDASRKKVKYYGPLVDKKRHKMVCEPGDGTTAIGVRQCALADPLSDHVPCVFTFGKGKYMLEMEPSVTPDLFLDANQIVVWSEKAFMEKTDSSFPSRPPAMGAPASQEYIMKEHGLDK